MSIKVRQTDLPGVLLIEPRVFSDDRGFFLETHQSRKYKEAGIDTIFVQDNCSRSQRNTLRGLHFQSAHPQAKLVYAISGTIFDVAVDIRPGSSTFGKWFGVELNEENHLQIFIPAGFAHGFCVLSETADVLYKCSDQYYPEDDFGIRWNDPQIGIAWPVRNLLLSPKDIALPLLSEMPQSRLPRI